MADIIPNFPVTPVFALNRMATHRVVVNRGGTRSSKTYSLAQLFIFKFFEERNKRFLIARKTLPALKLGAQKDIFDILKEHNLWHLVEYRKQDNTLVYGSNEMVFSSIDDPQKFRGPEWNYVWLNEANELPFEAYQQLILRLSRNPGTERNQMFLDFNPDNPNIWIKVELEEKGQCQTITSTYRDNPFLHPDTIAEIEYLRENDPNFWTIYGMGEYGQRIKGLIYPQSFSVLPHAKFPADRQIIYGLDFGFSAPTALVEIALVKDGPNYGDSPRLSRLGTIYEHETIYQAGLTNAELIELLQGIIPKDRRKATPIYADAAEPQRIEEIHRAGFNIHAADKSRGSVGMGLDFCKRFPFVISLESPNILAEHKSYKYITDRTGEESEEPVKFMDHAMDARRYAIYTHGQKYWIEKPPLRLAAADRPTPTKGPRSAKNNLFKGYD